MAGPSGKRAGGQGAPPSQPKVRLDKWLFGARFFRSRELASTMIEKGHLRINGQRCKKSGHGVLVGDTLTFIQADAVRVVRIEALADRRGSATIAQQLYTDLTPSAP